MRTMGLIVMPLGALLLAASSVGHAATCPPTDTIRMCVARFQGESPVPTPAQGASATESLLCVDKETLQVCHARLVEDALAQATAAGKKRAAEKTTQAVEKTESELEGKTTGGDSYADRVGGTIKNFLPLLGGLVGNPVSGSGGKSLALNLNLAVFSPDGSRNLQAQMVLAEPELSQQVRDALKTVGQSEAATELAKGLGDFDDLTAVLSWSPVNDRLGRSLRPHHAYLAALFAAAIAREDALTLAAATVNDVWDKQVQAIGNSDNMLDVELACLGGPARAALETALATFANQNGRNVTWSDVLVALGESRDVMPAVSDIAGRCLPHATRAVLERPLAQSVAAIAAAELGIANATIASGLRTFANLVNNQPQVFISASHRFADDLVSSEETVVGLTWERGLVNLNRIKSSEREACSDETRGLGPSCLTAFTQAFGSPEMLASAASGERIAFSLEYRRRDANTVTLPTYGVDLRTDSSSSVVAMFSYGRYILLPADGGQQRARLDLVARWEEYRNDPTRNNRLVASLTLTQRINDSFDFPITVSYANRPELLGDVTKRLSAHVGITYKLPGATTGGS